MRRNPMLAGAVFVLGLVVASCVTQNGMGQNKEKPTAASNQSAAASSQPTAKDQQQSKDAGTHGLVGDWSGAIVAAGQNIEIHLHFHESGGELSGTIDIPEQAASGLPLEQIQFKPPNVSFILHAGSDTAQFKGTLEGGRMSGSFQQGPASGTFAVIRSPGGGGTAAPSNPGGEGQGSPIELKTPTGTIHGTLDLPTGRGPFPVALIIAGSGPTDRNGNSPLIQGKNNSLLMIAEVLRAAGIASVRYDKRGIGQSASAMKSEADLRFSDYIDDAASWIDLLKHDPRFTKVAVIGHSEGSLIGMVAAGVAGADAFVSIAGAGFPAGQILKQQLANQPETIRSEAYSIIDSLEAGKEVKNVSQPLMALFRPSVQPYLISWFRYDPRKEIARLTVPILILQGTTDLQVSVKDAEALHAAQPRSTLDIIQGMNHVMKIAPENRQENIAAYGNPNLPLAPALVKGLTNFLKSVL